MNSQATKSSHDTVDGLLPWYVNGTLDGIERAAVDAHVVVCSECRQSLSLLRDIDSAIDHDAAPLVPAPRPERLLATIDSVESRQRTGRRAWIAAAGIAVVAVTVAILAVWSGSDDRLPALYETATSTSQPGAIDYIVELQFTSGLDEAARDDVLRAISGKLPRAVDGSGAYRVVVSLDAATLVELEAAIDAIESQPGIESARVVAVQLPVE